MEDKHISNQLMYYRKRLRLSQKQVATILGLGTIASLSQYERGAIMPDLDRALAFEILYRVPVAFLFPKLYEGIRSRVRKNEARFSHLLN